MAGSVLDCPYYSLKNLCTFHPESFGPLCLALPFQFQCLGLLPSALPLTNRSHRAPDANNTDVFIEALSLGDFLSESSCVFFSPQVSPRYEDPGPSCPTCESLCMKPSVTIQCEPAPALPSASPRLRKACPITCFISSAQHPCLLQLQPICLLRPLFLCLIIPREGPPTWAGNVWAGAQHISISSHHRNAEKRRASKMWGDDSLTSHRGKG